MLMMCNLCISAIISQSNSSVWHLLIYLIFYGISYYSVGTSTKILLLVVMVLRGPTHTNCIKFKGAYTRRLANV